MNAAFIETVPEQLDNVDNGIANFRGNVETDNEVLGKFRKVSLAFPDV